ncbi:hypothetical protein GCM10029963_37780 [Micromonospora andamanensis]|uniref:peptidase inhibitor family I36 protein n=1 Tax=Micromonospora andamanensis TaxID=1287068 RepID=UPI0019500783|nr:peptidase inhibitor family I36 protein [Micromonospora andamanensis]GIJ40687.1 hypothetical protein Vwe01_40120 [Micromonospora andamanensis]
MKKVRQILAILGLATIIFVAAPPVAAQAAWDCPTYNMCVWDTINGTGKRCAWHDRDADWHNSPTVCSWAKNWPVRSARNNSRVNVYIFDTPHVVIGADPILTLSPGSSRSQVRFYGSWHYFY